MAWSTYLPTFLWLYSPFVGPWLLFQFLNLFTQSVRLLTRGIIPRKTATYTHSKRTETSMP
jgi:hypothetical protein